MGVAAEDFVRAFAGQHDFEAVVADHLAEQELGHAVRVGGQRFAVPDRVGEVVGQLRLLDRQRMEVGAGHARPSPGPRLFVVLGHVEAEREGLDRVGVMPGGDAQQRAAIEPAAEIAAHRHVGPQADAHGFVERVRIRSMCSCSLRCGCGASILG